MAPLITISVQALLTSIGLRQHQVPAIKSCHTPVKAMDPSLGTSSLSAISWGYNRMDIYGQNAENDTVSHKWWDGYQWGPSWDTMEDLGVEAIGAPSAVSWGKDHMDIFTRTPEGELAHKYWDSTAWKPSETDFDSLGGDIVLGRTDLATVSWGDNRLDVFAIHRRLGGLIHKFWDGSAWLPEDDMEMLGGRLGGGVSAVSWGKGRLDVFAIGQSGEILHLYYDGTNWSNWEDMKAPVFMHEPTVISWGENRLDVFAISRNTETLYHMAWDGTKWLAWEDLGGSALFGKVAAVSWGVNRMDIVALGMDDHYYYKYWDGSQWNPQDGKMYDKGGNFSSFPAVVSWGENRLDIFGVTDDEQLGHQTWYGSGWYPEWNFEKLGGTLAAVQTNTMRKHDGL